MTDKVKMESDSIAFFLQHYLTPSMTFIYRQLQNISNTKNIIVIASNMLENTNIFPFSPIYYKSRNFKNIKTSKIFTYLYGHHKLLSIAPRLSYLQQKYFEEILQKKKIKLIHAQFGPSGLEIFPIAKKLNIPLIVSFHGYDASVLLKYPQYIKNLKKLFDYALIITPTQYMLQQFKGIGLDHFANKIIHYGIPLDFFRYKEENQIRNKFMNNEKVYFLQVSNFVEKKGHKYTLIAFKNLSKRYPNIHLTLAGEGLLRNKIEKLCYELGVEQNVSFSGLVNQDQVKLLMEKSDIFLHHSVTAANGDQEGVPNVIMEAMASGLPVISTFHAGIPELIDDGINGYLVEERDVDSYSEKMYNILMKGDEFKQIARKRIEDDYNLEKESEKLVNIYNNIISKKYFYT